jgi:hypothetical protein
MAIGGWRRCIRSLALGIALAGAGAPAAQPAAGTGLVDLEGRGVDPFLAGSPAAAVFVFVRTDCPISNRYAPEMRRLQERFAGPDMAFWLVYADPDETADAIRRHVEEYGYKAAALRDPEHAFVRFAGARVTPEAAVYLLGSPGPRLVYRGRIDDRYVALGQARPAPTTRDLEDVLTAIAAGARPDFRSTAAVGCFIPELR